MSAGNRGLAPTVNQRGRHNLVKSWIVRTRLRDAVAHDRGSRDQRGQCSKAESIGLRPIVVLVSCYRRQKSDGRTADAGMVRLVIRRLA